MIIIYGMPTCPYCDYVHAQIQGREDEFTYINIGENIRNMGGVYEAARYKSCF